jgi:hypothetical protein
VADALKQAELVETVPVSAPERAALVARMDDAGQVNDLFRLAFEKGGATPEALAQLVALKERIDRRNAELEFAQAMVAFQQTCPAIPRTSTAKIATRSGVGYEYKFADFEQIVETVRPHLQRHGLSFTFDSKTDGKMLTCTATLRHINGHSVDSSFTLPTETASAMSAQQAVGAALTFAKRQCIVSVLGLSLTDPSPDGDRDLSTLSDEQAATIKSMLDEVPAYRAKFLTWQGVEKVEDIPARRYNAAVAALNAKRRAGA